jgi:tRNA (guanine-N7-)-methyltransferase
MTDEQITTPSSERASSLIVGDERRLPTFSEIFGNTNPVEIEIGCGKAKFLLARAAECPRINFLGIDIVWKWMKYGVRRSEKRGLVNVRFLKADARETIRYGVPPESVSVFHIYFPDPWPKRKHRKRRIVTGDFLGLLHERLTEGGFIELATDHTDYYLQMESAVIQSGLSWSSVKKTSDERLFEALSKTNYEIKYEAAGRKLHYLELGK